MLFDLRDPRRKNAIRVIYATLAILMGGGLIFFGIGGEVSGGLVDRFTDQSGSSTFDDQIEEAEERLEENPRDQQAQLDLVSLNVQAGFQQADEDDEGNFILTSDSQESFGEAADAWDQYLRLNPPEPDDGAALTLANAFFVVAQNATSGAEFRRAINTAADAQRVAADQNSTIGNLRNLATFLYYAGRFERGDEVADQLAKRRPGTRRQLQQVKQEARRIDRLIKQEAEGQAAGGNPLDQTGGLGGGTIGTP